MPFIAPAPGELCAGEAGEAGEAGVVSIDSASANFAVSISPAQYWTVSVAITTSRKYSSTENLINVHLFNLKY